MRSGRDDTGRPIVAELGRAETPEESADRKAAARATRRSNQTALNLVIALVASLGVVLFLIVVVVRPDPPRPAVDYVAVAEGAQGAVGETRLAVPELPQGWSSNRAELEQSAADDVTRWEVGFLTPDDGYIGLVQGIDANASWIADQVQDARAGEEVSIGGLRWTSYDRRDAANPGNLAYALVAESGPSTIVLGGTASDEEFRTLAEAVAESLG